MLKDLIAHFFVFQVDTEIRTFGTHVTWLTNHMECLIGMS